MKPTKPTILIIDDEVSFLETIKELLEVLEYNAITLADEEESLNMCLKHKPDLVLCDLNMPKRSGFEVVSQLKFNDSTADIPVLMLTANAQRENMRKGMNSGADDFLTKPIAVGELQDAIEAQFKKSLFQKTVQASKSMDLRPAHDKAVQYEQDQNDSLRSAARIQDHVKARMPKLGTFFPSSFILNLPSNIVSGDSYWVSQREGKTLVAVMDCTGHGLPAAMLMMLCHSKLEEAVESYGLLEPTLILEKVDSLVTSLLGREGQSGLGMDIGLCSIDTLNRSIRYAGANRPLYLYGQQRDISNMATAKPTLHLEKDHSFLLSFRGNKFGIGSRVKQEQSFSMHEFGYQKGDVIYMNSDGYQDQFGGPDNKKFKRKHFRELLFSLRTKNLKDQLDILEETHREWKGKHEQTDDILVMGIELP